jgi:hypothetical protein
MISKTMSLSAVFGCWLGLGLALPAFAGHGPSGLPSAKPKEPRPFSLNRDVLRTRGVPATRCEIFMDHVTTTVTYSDGSVSLSHAQVVYTENVPSLNVIRQLVTEVETGQIVSLPAGNPDALTTKYSVEVAEGGPNVVLSQAGPVQLQNDSEYATDLESFIESNCNQVMSPETNYLSGIWGGQGINLTATDKGVSMEFGCGSARIQQNVELDEQGHFEAEGITLPGVMVPVGVDRSKPAHFAGDITGDELTLTVDRGSAASTYHLKFGVVSFFPTCK